MASPIEHHNTGAFAQVTEQGSAQVTLHSSPGFSCSDFNLRDGTINFRVHSSAWPIRVASLDDAVESARSVGAHYEDAAEVDHG